MLSSVYFALKFCANLNIIFNKSGSLIGRYELASKCGFKAVESAFFYNIPLPELIQAETIRAIFDQILIYPELESIESKSMEHFI